MNRYQLLQRLRTASVTCHDCGAKYGVYSVSMSSMWHGTCHVCERDTVVTETRDYGYFITGIRKLRAAEPDCSGVKP